VIIVLQRIEEQGIPVGPAFSTANSLELSPKGVSKGAALVELCQLPGIPVEKGVAVGDSGNDLDMLRDAGLGIAMGNASSDVLAAADVVVADNDHGGCAEAIYTYLL
jgi:hydroxymethylpyrimidine pyrophosphatase-like HAD family hydrolase